MQAVIQLRGEVNLSESVRDTLEMLHLGQVNHCTFVHETSSYRGMLTKVTDVAAIGEPSPEMVAEILERRGEPAGGDGSIDEEWVAEHTDYNDVAELAGALCDEDTTLTEAGLEPVLRLHPPRGGHRGIKHHRTDGGQLGQHSTEEIDELLHQMR